MFIFVYPDLLKNKTLLEVFKGHYPESCGLGSKFDERKIKSIETDLKQNWPNFYSRGSGFWKHEWKKHGRCSVGNKSESMHDVTHFGNIYYEKEHKAKKVKLSKVKKLWPDTSRFH